MLILSQIIYIIAVALLFLLLIYFVLYLLAVNISILSRVPFVPSKRIQIEEIFSFVQPQKGKIFYDLGSGDGRVVISASKKYGLKAIGIEFNPLLILFSNIRARLSQAPSARFIRADLLKYDFSNADYIYLFLFPSLLDRLVPQLKKGKKGTYIISHGFKIDDLESKLESTHQAKPFSTYFYRL